MGRRQQAHSSGHETGREAHRELIPVDTHIQYMHGRRQALGQLHGVGKEPPRIDGESFAIRYDRGRGFMRKQWARIDAHDYCGVAR
jgi:hypothetical protein